MDSVNSLHVNNHRAVAFASQMTILFLVLLSVGCNSSDIDETAKRIKLLEERCTSMETELSSIRQRQQTQSQIIEADLRHHTVRLDGLKSDAVSQGRQLETIESNIQSMQVKQKSSTDSPANNETAVSPEFPHRIVEYSSNVGSGYGVRMFIPSDSNQETMMELANLMRVQLMSDNVQVGFYSDRCPTERRYMCFNALNRKFGEFHQGDMKTASDLQRPDFWGTIDEYRRFHPPDPGQAGKTIDPQLREHYDAIIKALRTHAD
jgi:hypothetical protein